MKSFFVFWQQFFSICIKEKKIMTMFFFSFFLIRLIEAMLTQKAVTQPPANAILPASK